jgi:hypothetical protein
MNRAKVVLHAIVIATAAAVALGCDPAGPAAEGTISLGTGVSDTGFATLELRMFPDPGADFDPANGLPQGLEYFITSHHLAQVTFPYEYFIGAGAGTTENPRWMVIAWLATQELGDQPTSGEIFGTRTFKIKECGAFFGGYCDTTRGVDVVIETQLP